MSHMFSQAIVQALRTGEAGFSEDQLELVRVTARDAVATVAHASTHPSTASSMYLGTLEPDALGVETPSLLDDYVQLWGQLGSDSRSCKLCGRGLVNERRGRWTHLAADGTLKVGCRAASWTPPDGWDDSLPRHWRAQS